MKHLSQYRPKLASMIYSKSKPRFDGRPTVRPLKGLSAPATDPAVRLQGWHGGADQDGQRCRRRWDPVFGKRAAWAIVTLVSSLAGISWRNHSMVRRKAPFGSRGMAGVSEHGSLKESGSGFWDSSWIGRGRHKSLIRICCRSCESPVQILLSRQSIYLPIDLSTYLSTYRSICLSTYLTMCPSIHPSIHPSVHPSIARFTSLPLYV